ncbi:MAG: tRNA lysidine(34) synthetase TilS, partial [Anaerolineales bacterium]
MKLRERIRRYVEERELLRPGSRVVLGVSGGPDSLCLLDLLHALAPEWNLTLHVAHLNHGLRPEAAAEAEFVRAEAQGRDLPFHSEIADTRAQAQANKKSIEEAARELRYAFLTRTAVLLGAEAIAVAHTADDQVETVLMHFLRGAGLAGLKGMLPSVEIGSWKSGVRGSDLRPPTAGLYLTRPLLNTTRAEVEAYCAEHDLRPLRDASNLDTTFFRNRLRHALLPELEKYNPNLRAVLGRTAEVAAGEYELLQAVVEILWNQVAQPEFLQVKFDRARWIALGVPEQRALLRRAVQHLRFDLRNVDFTPLERAVRFSRRAAPGRSCDVLGGLRLKVTSEALVLSSWEHQPAPAEVPLVESDGRLTRNWRFYVETLDPGTWSLAEVESNPDPGCAYVDADRLSSPRSQRAQTEEGAGEWGLRVRPRRPGDRFQPLGMGGHRIKVSDFMINAKVDESLRDGWPLVVCGDEIVWVAGLRQDERFKVTAETQT